MATYTRQLTVGARSAVRFARALTVGARSNSSLTRRLTVGARSRTTYTRTLNVGARTGRIAPAVATALATLATARQEALAAGNPGAVFGSLLTIQPEPFGRVTCGGAELAFETVTLEEALNTGWKFSVELKYPFDPDDYPENSEWRVYLEDGLGNAVMSPPMIAVDPDVTDAASIGGPSTTVSGVDRAMYELGRRAESLPTFRWARSSAVVAAIQTATQVPGFSGVVIQGMPDYPIIIEDIKQAQLSDAFNRLRGVYAYDSQVNSSGAIVCSPWETLDGNFSFFWSSLRKSTRKQSYFTKMGFGKRSPLVGATSAADTTPNTNPPIEFDAGGVFTQKLVVPLAAAQVYNKPGSIGYVDQYVYYDGEPRANGRIVGYGQLVTQSVFQVDGLPGGISTGVPPITHILYVVKPPSALSLTVDGKLIVMGQPWHLTAPAVNQGVGLDPSFYTVLTTTEASGTQVRGAGDWIETLFVSQAQAQERGPYILGKKREGAGGLHFEGPMQFNNRLKSRYSYKGKAYKMSRQSHKFSVRGQYTTSVDFTLFAPAFGTWSKS